MANTFIPRSDSEFGEFAQNFVDHAGQLQLSSALVQALRADNGQWKLHYEKHLDAQEAARAATQGKDSARADFTAKIREAAAIVQANPDISDEEKVAAGLPVYKTTRTPASVPTTRPVVEVDTSQRLAHVIHFRDEGSSSKARPKGVQGAEIWAKIGDAPPASENELRFMGLDTRTPYTAKFDFEDGGKTCYYMLRWVNTRQESGPWSETIEATIVG